MTVGVNQLERAVWGLKYLISEQRIKQVLEDASINCVTPQQVQKLSGNNSTEMKEQAMADFQTM